MKKISLFLISICLFSSLFGMTEEKENESKRIYAIKGKINRLNAYVIDDPEFFRLGINQLSEAGKKFVSEYCPYKYREQQELVKALQGLFDIYLQKINTTFDFLKEHLDIATDPETKYGLQYLIDAAMQQYDRDLRNNYYNFSNVFSNLLDFYQYKILNERNTEKIAKSQKIFNINYVTILRKSGFCIDQEQRYASQHDIETYEKQI